MADGESYETRELPDDQCVIRGKRKVEDERLSTWTSVRSFKTLHGAFDS